MSATHHTRHDEQALRQKMDLRTLAEQDCELRYIRRRMERLAGRTDNALHPASATPGTRQAVLAAA